MSEKFDPYHQWLGIPASEQPPHHYRLLGVSAFEDSPAVIENAADQRMAHLRTFQAGQNGAESQRLLNEVATARICLLSVTKKAAYDTWLRDQLQSAKGQLNPRQAPGAYTAEISRVNPTCFLFLVDQSGSMSERWGGEAGKTKAEGVADAINRLFQTLVRRCSKGETILDRYYIGAVGYGGQPGKGDGVSLGLPVEALSGNIVQPVSMIKNHPLRIEARIKLEDDGVGGLVQKHIRFPIWFEPRAQGKTPMCSALRAAHEVVGQFVSAHPGCFPPIVINISDGAATDGNATQILEAANAIHGVASQDGNVLLFNVHLSVRGDCPILFPASQDILPDDYARLLYRMSSPLPPSMRRQAQLLEASVKEGAVGFAFNADLASVIMFLDIGTRADQNAA